MELLLVGLVLFAIWFTEKLGKRLDLMLYKNGRKLFGYICPLLAVALMFGDIPLRELQFYYLTEIKSYPPLEIDNDHGYVHWGTGTGCDVNCQDALFSGFHEIIEIDVKTPNREHLTDAKGEHLFYVSGEQDEMCFSIAGKKVTHDGHCIASKKIKNKSFLSDDAHIYISQEKVKHLFFPYELIVSTVLFDDSREYRYKSRRVSMKGWWIPRLGFYHTGNMFAEIDIVAASTLKDRNNKQQNKQTSQLKF